MTASTEARKYSKSVKLGPSLKILFLCMSLMTFEVNSFQQVPLGGLSTFGQGRENFTLLHANNKGGDQPVHPRSLISAYVVQLY